GAALETWKAARARGFLTRTLLPAAALALAVILVAAVLVGGRMRRTMRHLRDTRASLTAAENHQRAAGELRRQLVSTVQSAQDVRELLQSALRTRFDLPAGEITPHDAARRLLQAGVDEGLANACSELLEACSMAEFAPGINSVPLPELAARAERLIAQLAKCKSVNA